MYILVAGEREKEGGIEGRWEGWIILNIPMGKNEAWKETGIGFKIFNRLARDPPWVDCI